MAQLRPIDVGPPTRKPSPRVEFDVLRGKVDILHCAIRAHCTELRFLRANGYPVPPFVRDEIMRLSDEYLRLEQELLQHLKTTCWPRSR